jgi:hypothetical protein
MVCRGARRIRYRAFNGPRIKAVPKGWCVSYGTAEVDSAGSGELVVSFHCDHGWSCRNRGTGDVLVQLITTGTQTRIDKHV